MLGTSLAAGAPIFLAPRIPASPYPLHPSLANTPVFQSPQQTTLISSPHETNTNIFYQYSPIMQPTFLDYSPSFESATANCEFLANHSAYSSFRWYFMLSCQLIFILLNVHGGWGDVMCECLCRSGTNFSFLPFSIFHLSSIHPTSIYPPFIQHPSIFHPSNIHSSSIHPTSIYPPFIQHPSILHPSNIHLSSIHPTSIYPPSIQHPSIFHPSNIHLSSIHPTSIYPPFIQHPFSLHPFNINFFSVHLTSILQYPLPTYLPPHPLTTHPTPTHHLQSARWYAGHCR